MLAVVAPGAWRRLRIRCAAAVAVARPPKIDVPAELRANAPAGGNAELSRCERDVVRFLTPHYRTCSNFPGYFAAQGLNFQMLRQLLPEYFADRYGLILEVGCGTGFQSLLLSPHADTLVGIDIPGEYLGYVMPGFASSAEMATFLVNDCLVFSWTVLEHVPALPPADSFTHPMMEAGFAIERLLWLRDFNVAIVARKR